MKVFIVAATPVLRAGLRALLSPASFGSSGASAQVVGDSDRMDSLPPNIDVLLIAPDEFLPPSLATTLADYHQPPGLVVLSTDSRRLADGLSSLPIRGWSIVPPDVSAVSLQAVVEAVGQGMVVLPQPLAGNLLKLAENASSSFEMPVLEAALTLREQEILELLGQGLSNKLIARQLQISEHTVKFHVSSLYTKLDASSRADAVSRGARLGLITF